MKKTFKEFVKQIEEYNDILKIMENSSIKNYAK